MRVCATAQKLSRCPPLRKYIYLWITFHLFWPDEYPWDLIFVSAHNIIIWWWKLLFYVTTLNILGCTGHFRLHLHRTKPYNIHNIHLLYLSPNTINTINPGNIKSNQSLWNDHLNHNYVFEGQLKAFMSHFKRNREIIQVQQQYIWMYTSLNFTM